MAAKHPLLKGSHMTHALFGGALAHIEPSDRAPVNQSSPMLADMGVCHMDVQFVDAPAFKEVYIRNNRTKGRKHIRCFPTCAEVHNATGFCGRPLTVDVEMRFADEATAAAVFPQLLFFGEVLPAFIADSTMLSSISSYSIETNVWGASNPEGCLYRGRMATSTTTEIGEDGQLIQKLQLVFNDSLLRAWQYDWQNPAKCKSGHCFCVHVFHAASVPSAAKPPGSPAPSPDQDEQRYVELYRGCSPTFRIVSARRFKTRTAEDDPGSEVIMQRKRTDPAERPPNRTAMVKPKRTVADNAALQRDMYLKTEAPESQVRIEREYNVAAERPNRTHESYYLHPSLTSGYLPVTVIGHPHHPHAHPHAHGTHNAMISSHPREVAEGMYHRPLPAAYPQFAVSFRPTTYSHHHPATPALYSIRSSVESPYVRTALPVYAPSHTENEYRHSSTGTTMVDAVPYSHYHHPVYIGATVTPPYAPSVSTVSSISRSEHKTRPGSVEESPQCSSSGSTPKRPRMN